MSTFWKGGGLLGGKPRNWLCINCGRADIYHDQKTGACPDRPKDPNLKPKAK